jgi:hypothetical protein
MITRHGWYGRAFSALAVLALGLVLTTAAGAAEVTADNLDEHIAAAKTAADHEAIAAYFHSKADELGEQAKRHEAMLAAYKKGGSKQYLNMITHCRAIIGKSRELQKDYLEMAKLHEGLAKSAGK